MHTPLRCLAPVVLALATVAGTACDLTFEDREPGLDHPDETTVIGATPEGLPIVQSPLENPMLQGFFTVDLGEITIARDEPLDSALILETQTYTHPSAPLFAVDGQEGLGWLDVARGDLEGVVEEFGARGQRIQLAQDGTPTRIEMWSVVPDPAEPDGMTRALLGAASYVLDPETLVLPVSVTVFVDEDGNAPYISPRAPEDIEPVVQQLFDPAAARSSGAPDGDRMSVEASVPIPFTEIAPDRLLAQCGIQFRLETVDVVPQSVGLETTLTNTDRPCRTDDTPLGAYIPVTLDAAGAIPVFVGGEIKVELLPEYLGITCPPASPVEFIAMEGHELLTRSIMAHELGHFVGLQHTTEPDNLMNEPAAGGSGFEIRGTQLQDEQCARARCDAAKLLRRWGRIDRDREDEVCSPFAAMCGNGVPELGESCDDGNQDDGDGCREDCTREVCGDARLDPGEACDWGIDPENCDLSCNVCVGCTVCGDGDIDPYEECDPPDGVTCDDSCRFTFI